MLVTHINRKNGTDYIELAADVISEAGHFEPLQIWFRYPLEYQGQVNTNGDAFLAATLLPAMVLGEPLRIIAPVSPRLLKSQTEIQAIFTSWVAEARRVPVEAAPAIEKDRTGNAVAGFFSGGVDSFYTYLKHQDEIDYLIMIRGFDPATGNDVIFERLHPLLRQMAAADNKQPIIAETNCRIFTNGIVRPGMYHGSILAAVALGLSGLMNKIYIPASSSYVDLDLHPWGTHPLLDPLWSTGNLEIKHDGCEAGRLEKTLAVAASRTALQMLRVCRSKKQGEANCGRCEKCLRTMTGLHLAGKFDECATFPKPFTPRALRHIKLKSAVHLQSSLEIVQALAERNDPLSRDLYRAWKRLVRNLKIRIFLLNLRGKPLY